jgi:hypothetical protein
MESVVIYSGHLEYFLTISYILEAFGNFVVIWFIVPRKIWQPWIRDDTAEGNTNTCDCSFASSLAAG